MSFFVRAATPLATREKAVDDRDSAKARAESLRATARVKVGSKTFVWASEPANSGINGPEDSLTRAEARALDGAANDLWRASLREAPKAEWTFERVWLNATLATIADAPAGFEFTDHTGKVRPSVGPESTVEVAEDDLRAVDFQTLDTRTLETRTADLRTADPVACRAEALGSGDFVALAACARRDQDGVGGTYKLTCETKVRPHQHDANRGSAKRHCFRKRYAYSGKCSSGCKGQCGEYCRGRGTYGGYYQDCLDHDMCFYHHDSSGGSGSPICGDEYDEAVNDTREAARRYAAGDNSLCSLKCG